MKQGAIIETVCHAQEWYPGLLTPMCDELATFGFVWGASSAADGLEAEPKEQSTPPRALPAWRPK
jgi:hypothetical protein